LAAENGWQVPRPFEHRLASDFEAASLVGGRAGHGLNSLSRELGVIADCRQDPAAPVSHRFTHAT
jgi:hypothetical protein